LSYHNLILDFILTASQSKYFKSF